MPEVKEDEINPDVLIVENDDVVVPEPGTNETDTETETVDSEDKSKETTDTETETVKETDVDPYQKRFDELGLGSQFADPADVLNRVGDANRHMDSLQKANAQQKKQIEQLMEIKKPVPTAEELAERMETDPTGAMTDAGFARTENVQELQTKIDHLEFRDKLRGVADTVSQYPELDSIASSYRLGRAPVDGSNKFWDAMNAKMSSVPGLSEAPFETQIAVLYPMIKADLATKKVPDVPKLSEKDKAEANTTGSGARNVGSDQADYSKMNADDIRADYEKRNMIGP